MPIAESEASEKRSMLEFEKADRNREHLPLTTSLVLVFLCFLWGGNLVSIKISNQGVPPILAAAIRSATAAGLLWAFARARHQEVLLPREDLRYGAIIGALFGLEFLCLYSGLVYTPVSRGTIFLYMHPFWVAIGAHLLLPKDRLTVLKSAGLLMAFIGLFAAFRSRSATLAPVFWLGDLLELAAAFFWASTTLYVKKIAGTRNISHYQTLFAQLLFSVPVLSLGWLVLERSEPYTLTLAVLVAIGYQCLVVAFFSYLIWFWMIHRFPVSRLSAFTFLAPVFGVVLSGLVLREPIPLLLWAGLVLIAAGIYVVNQSAKIPRSATLLRR
jgi:drug/metabolite transporter (DMT)-like permease